MTRTNLIASIAAAIGSTMLFASAAQACISCEYVPEVLNASKASSHRSSGPQSSTAVRAQMAKAQMLKAQAAKAQMAKAMAAKARAAAKKVETASLMQKTDAPVVKAVAKNAESSTAGSGSIREKVVSTATLLVGESVSAEAEPSEPVACKKFIAAIGTTVTVPCK